MSRRVLWSIVLLLPLVVSITWLAKLDWERKVSTNVLDLIPQHAAAPELAVARNILETVYADRVAVALSHVTNEASLHQYIAHLCASDLVESVVDLSANTGFEELGNAVIENRIPLLFPQWLEHARDNSLESDPEALAKRAVIQLEAALERPSVLAFEEIIPQDPLLLVPTAAQALQGLSGRANLPAGTYLLEVKLAVSALTKEGQIPVFDLFEQALELGRVASPEMTAIDSGAHRFAAMTESKMKREVNWLNCLTLLSVLTICLLLCRRALLVVHVFAMMSVSLVISLALITTIFDRIDIFALVFGCVLCGVIVDYGLHAYLHGAGRPQRNLKAFLRPFLISSGSTMAGFLILLFSGLPVMQQMGAFVSCGLGVATLVTLIYTFGILKHDAALPVRKMAQIRRLPVHYLLPALSLLTLPLLPFITWEDDIRSLKYPLPELEQTEAEINALRGGDRDIFISFGTNHAETLEHLSQFGDWLENSGVPAEAYLSPGQWLPQFDTYLAAGEFAKTHPEFGEQVLRQLDANGYDAEAFAPFLQSWESYANARAFDAVAYDQLIQNFSTVLTATLPGMAGEADGLYWWLSLVDDGYSLGKLPPETRSMRLDQIQSLSQVLASYRHHMLTLSLWAAGIIYLILLLVFRWRVGSIIMSVPVAAVCQSAVILFYSAGSLGMFHLVGMFLGVCLVLDYAVFTWIGCQQEGRMPFSVLVSALTTSASFFILSQSHIPSIHALGLAVFSVTSIGVILNYTFIPKMEQRGNKHG